MLANTTFVAVGTPRGGSGGRAAWTSNWPLMAPVTASFLQGFLELCYLVGQLVEFLHHLGPVRSGSSLRSTYRKRCQRAGQQRRSRYRRSTMVATMRPRTVVG